MSMRPTSSRGFSRVPMDTTPEAYAAQIEAYRRMGGKERTAVTFRLNELARETAAAGDAMKRRRQFNAIHAQSAVKIDLIVRKDRPFSREELGRRQRAVLPGGTRVSLATPEDTILSKLEWARKGG